MEHRVLQRERTILGATLTVSTLNGWSVSIGRDYLGYLHASVGDQFNVYCCRRGRLDDWLARSSLVDGVRHILKAAGRATEEVA